MRLLIAGGVLLAVLMTGATAGVLYKIWSHSQSQGVGARSAARSTVSLNAAKQEFDQGDILFLDARGLSSYEAGHIPGALHVPAEAPTDRLREALAPYPPGTRVITYCSGNGCRSSDTLARRLRGDLEFRNVDILDGGFPAWKRAEFPIATSAAVAP